jgi:hypothetical protein
MKRFLAHPLAWPCIAVIVSGSLAVAWWRFHKEDPTEQPVTPPNNEAVAQDEKLLPLSERQRVWDIEHLAFLFEAEVFPVWKKALVETDRATLERAFKTDFAGLVPKSPAMTPYQSQVITVRQSERTKDDERQVTSAGMINELFSLRRKMDANPDSCKVSMGLVRFGPVELKKTSGPWRSVWKIRLAGTRSLSRVEIVILMTTELDSVDEKIGQRQHWLQSASIDRITVTESPRALMREVTRESGIAITPLHDNWSKTGDVKFRTKTGGVYLCDYDKDGNLDALVEDRLTGAVLYRGLGNGQFEDATEKAKLPRMTLGKPPLWTLSCWVDLDGDGDEDLISQDKLFENRGDGTFRDVTKNTNLLLTPAASYAIGDFDLDGRVDIYVCHSNKYLTGQQTKDQTPWIDGGLGIDNVLWKNLGNWQFEDVTHKTNAGGKGTACFAAVWFDANNDRWPDLLAVNEFGRNSLLINHSGKFVEKVIDPVFGGFSMGVTAGDFNNDGHADLYVANMYSKAGNRIVSNVDRSVYPAALFQKVREATTGNKLYLSKGDGTFNVLSSENIVADIGWAYGPGFVDLNGDGWLDIYSTAGFRSIERGKPDG